MWKSSFICSIYITLVIYWLFHVLLTFKLNSSSLVQVVLPGKGFLQGNMYFAENKQNPVFKIINHDLYFNRSNLSGGPGRAARSWLFVARTWAWISERSRTTWRWPRWIAPPYERATSLLSSKSPFTLTTKWTPASLCNKRGHPPLVSMYIVVDHDSHLRQQLLWSHTITGSDVVLHHFIDQNLDNVLGYRLLQLYGNHSEKSNRVLE